MDRAIAIVLIIVLGVVLIAGMGYMAFSSLLPSKNTITGNGEATIEVVPDLVKVYFNVETEGETSKEAKDENAEIVDDLIFNMVREGFDRDDIQTLNFNIYPEYSWDDEKRELDGYKATHTIIVEISTQDTDKIGDAIDAGVDAGANINYINFELSQEKTNQYKAEAIELAAEDARLKAKALADGLDKELGKLVSVSDGSFGYSPWRIYETTAAVDSVEMAKQATTNIQPGEQEISARVTAVFKIKKTLR